MSRRAEVKPNTPCYTLPALFESIAEDLCLAERIFEAELASTAPFVQELIGYLRHYRGKRLRPALLLLCARACGRVIPHHHTLAAVVEMIHTATLVHDDVLDHAGIRRHVPTVNARWGSAGSVLLGDLLFTHAFYLASTTGSTLACQLIGAATNRICEGELQQIGQRGNLDLGKDEYFAIIDGKTAELISCCCRLGGVFSEAETIVVEALARYGRALGIAFQITDDVLDLTGREQETGKSLGTDLEERKLTLPVLRLLDQADPEEVRSVRAILADSENHKRDKLLPYLRRTDALEYALQTADQYAEAARRELPCLPESPYRDVLATLPDMVVRRTR